ncbi:MAG: hypothetical protein K6G31_13360 [Paludibacteraceae bacterium]|nr:hypothetical protein [Paludibacteraceae bacterium]MBR6041048.1 hypothetical protein [Paludibacteraceae bacterium]MCR5570237.1 hypothetical protein [Paludibacteraceae bacterium]
MKKLNLFAGIACVVAFLVAGLLVALGKFPVVSEEGHDQLNQLSLLWILGVTGLNFFVYSGSFSPVLDRFYNVSRVLATVAGLLAVLTYFLEYSLEFEARSLFQSSIILAVLTLAFYFMVRHFDDDIA